MSWDDIESADNRVEQIKRAKEQKARDVELAKKFNRVFTSEDGKVVFEYLFKRFVLDNETPLTATNIEYEAGYHAGEAGVIKFMSHQMSKATTR